MKDASKLNLGVNVDVGQTIGELTKAITKFKENRTYNKTAYDELLEKYAEAIELIKKLEAELVTANESKMPSGEELENIGKMLDMVSVFNEKLPQIAKLQQNIKSLEN